MAAYDPNNSYQQGLLARIRGHETGSASNAYSLGYGGVPLASAPTDQYGFPQWAGGYTSAGPSHAAGAYQFQPGTWANVASKYGLNFQDPSQQDAGAWYNAQIAYAQSTGGGDLQTALQNGDPNVGHALSGQWSFLDGQTISPTMHAGAVTPAGQYPTMTITPQGSQTDPNAAPPTAQGAGSSAEAGQPGYLPPSQSGGPFSFGLTSGLAAGLNSWISGLETYAGKTVSGAETAVGSAFKTAASAAFGTLENLAIRLMLLGIGGLILMVALWAMVKDTAAGDAIKSAVTAPAE